MDIRRMIVTVLSNQAAAVVTPTCTITSTASTITAAEFTVTITFSDAVTGFDNTKITVGNGSAAAVSGTGPYASVITPTATGTVTVSVAAGAVTPANLVSNTFSILYVAPVWWFDWGDLTTLFQDTARSSPITADAQTIKGQLDKSGNANHVANSTGAPYKAAIQNGKSVVRFDGVATNRLSTGASVAHGIGTGDFYLIIALRCELLTNNYGSIWENGSFAPGLYRKKATTFLTDYWGTYHDYSSQLAVGNHVIEFYRESGVLKNIVDGVADATTFAVATSMANAVSWFGFSAASAFAGDLWEVMLFSSLPSTGARAALREYIAAKWSPF